MLDFYLAMRNPFYPRENRSKWYFLVIFAVLIPLVIITQGIQTEFAEVYMNIGFINHDRLAQRKIEASPELLIHVMRPYYALVNVLTAFSILSLIPFILVCIRLCRRGTSSALKRMVCCRFTSL